MEIRCENNLLQFPHIKMLSKTESNLPVNSQSQLFPRIVLLGR